MDTFCAKNGDFWGSYCLAKKHHFSRSLLYLCLAGTLRTAEQWDQRRTRKMEHLLSCIAPTAASGPRETGKDWVFFSLNERGGLFLEKDKK